MRSAWLYLLIAAAGALQAWEPPMTGASRNALPRPLPTIEGVSTMPWWAPFGGLLGAFTVIAGLTTTANILTSLAIDQFGMLHMPQHPMNLGRAIGVVLMVTGIALIARF